MKFKYYTHILFPSGAVALSLLALPFGLTAYFIISQYADKFMASQEVATYTAAEESFLGRLLVQQPWTDWLSRFSDFAFWGVLAAALLILIWVVSVARTSMQNHVVAEEFVNFKVTKASWHRHFAIEAGLKVLLVCIMFYAVIMLLAKAIPGLALSIGLLLESVSGNAIIEIIKSNAAIFGLEFLVVLAVKVFRHVQLD